MRHTRAHRCPICDGADEDARGKGKRCSGFTSGEWCHCSREERAGRLELESGGTYAHRRRGPCACGETHGEDVRSRDDVEATYDYHDERGELLFQVLRRPGKRFVQRRPDGAGGWVWKLDGVRRVPYRLPELVAADSTKTVWIVEGEKDVDTLHRRGLVATCNPHGAGKWRGVEGAARDTLRGRDVVVVADADEPGRTHAREVAASLRGHARGIRVVEAPRGKDVSEHLALGGTLEQLLEAASTAEAWPDEAIPGSRGPDDGKHGSDATQGAVDEEYRLKQAEIAIRIVERKASLFHDPSGDPYAIIRTVDDGAASPSLGARRVVRLRSAIMRSWIARAVRSELGRCVGAGVIEEALGTLEGIARFDREEQSVHLRVAEHEGAIYLDLGDVTGACVEATAERWRILDAAPVPFRRPDAMRPLPRPEHGGTLDDLRPFLNVADDDELHLLVAWLVAAYRPAYPFPVLAIHGEQGTAKTTAARVVRALVDPNKSPVRSAPRSDDDLVVCATHSHVVAFDNLSGVANWLSDALCRLATGAGIGKRSHYTNDDETVLDAIRPVVVNGIDDLANRADFAQRCLVLTLQPFSRAGKKWRSERAFWRSFRAAAPRILGFLLNGVVSALRELPRVELEELELPRMADFGQWIVAAAPGLGLPREALLRAYERNQARIMDIARDASSVATAVRRLLDQRGAWEGEPTHLLAMLVSLAPEEARRAPDWPRTPRALGNALRRSATFLRAGGIDLDLDPGRQGHEKRRVWRLARAAGPGAESALPQPVTGLAARVDAPAVPNGPQHGPHQEPEKSGAAARAARAARVGGSSRSDVLTERTDASKGA